MKVATVLAWLYVMPAKTPGEGTRKERLRALLAEDDRR